VTAPGEIAPRALGALRDRVQLQRRDMAPEDSGGHVTIFVPLATLWARVRALSPRAIQTADGRATEITHAVVLRYRDDVAPGDRFVCRGRLLDVRSAEDLNGRRVFLSCLCAETSFTG
jgi:SPP1 family predicted phage head-tail adaptor